MSAFVLRAEPPPRRKNPKHGPPLFLLTLCLLCATACANLEAVRQFSKTSAATADYQQVVADYAQSPARQQAYQPSDLAEELDADVEERAAQQARLEGAQKVLVQYMSALGDLAADKLPNVDAEVDGLGKALEKAKFIGEGDRALSKETGAAAGTLAKILTRAVLDHWRQRKVAQIIQEADPSVQTALAGLKGILSEEFEASLKVEEEAMNQCFEGALEGSKRLSNPDAVAPLIRILEEERKEQLQVRRKRLQAYQEVLDRIAKGHADLRQNVTRMTNEDLKARLRQYSKDLQALAKAIHTLSP